MYEFPKNIEKTDIIIYVLLYIIYSYVCYLISKTLIREIRKIWSTESVDIKNKLLKIFITGIYLFLLIITILSASMLILFVLLG